ncbi:MAG TPA: hypothetical protein VFM53_04785 [Anaeromyxobacteraceae bacterium]|nr:hypothetical protein [Anaeromyxobacteraceae bacterium]
MDAGEVDEVRDQVDALGRALAEERFRSAAGIEHRPALVAAFDAHDVAARAGTAAALRSAGDAALAARVAALAAERAAAAREEDWRAADAAATGAGPDGPVGVSDAAQALLHERDPGRRSDLARAHEEAVRSAAPPRESAAEVEAAARASLGFTPPWEDVVQADALLSASDAAWGDVLAWLASHTEGTARPGGGLDRAGLLQLLAFRDHDGLFRPAGLQPALLEGYDGLGVDVRRVRLDAASRRPQWPGAHAFDGRVSFRRQGGAADWLGLVDAAGRAAVLRATRPATRDPALAPAVGALGAGLLLEPRFLEKATGLERRRSRDVVRRLALRRLLGLRTAAAALRVAAEAERGLSGRAWQEAHREALGRATGATWPAGLAARDAGTERHRALLAGAAWAAAIRDELRDRFDEDYWRNPRTPEALAGRLAAGSPGPERERPPLARAAEALGELLGGS